jgi:hypothetical protein
MTTLTTWGNSMLVQIKYVYTRKVVYAYLDALVLKMLQSFAYIAQSVALCALTIVIPLTVGSIVSAKVACQ